MQLLNPAHSTVLLVEDDPDQAALLARSLETYGVGKLFLAETAEEAIQFLERQRVDVVLTDYRLPGMDGLRLLERIRESWPDTTVLLVTGQRDDRVAASAVKLGAADYIPKDELLTSGIIRSLQTALRERAALQDQERRDALSVVPSRFQAAREEADWVLESFAAEAELRGMRVPESSTLDVRQEDRAQAVEMFHRYLCECSARFPTPAAADEEALVRILVNRGLSPREIVLVYRAAVRLLTAGENEALISPALCLVRVLAGMIEHYQRAQALSAGVAVSAPLPTG